MTDTIINLSLGLAGASLLAAVAAWIGVWSVTIYWEAVDERKKREHDLERDRKYYE